MEKIQYENSLEFARKMDEEDSLSKFKEEFHIPEIDGKKQLYFCGNSLGLQPKRTQKYVQQELDDWAKLGVEGHTKAKHPWKPYHEFLTETMAEIVGAKPQEVVMMNTLTVNLHLMMVSFYQPTTLRRKIIIESDAFPSDKYAVQSQLNFHGYDPVEDLLLWEPRKTTNRYHYEDLKKLFADNIDEIALVLIGVPNYYTGQTFDLKKIAKLGHMNNALVGFDLAHGAGNIQPDLHDSQADFAVWCSYKYLNSGPGSVGGCFVHEVHADNDDLNRLTGWWGHNKETRFNMRQEFDPIKGAEGWQLSNPPILSMAAIRASLDVFKEAGFKNLRAKSIKLTGFLEFLMNEIEGDDINIITPENPAERGCQLSIELKKAGKDFFNNLTAAGVIADWREPNVIRLAPIPLYNSYEDVFLLVQKIKSLL
ncbi:MAG TPA: kynureninase [Flavobacteriaceae bacterium]|nr:kynureninase [Flavobacteriaceae bacterium]